MYIWGRPQLSLYIIIRFKRLKLRYTISNTKKYKPKEIERGKIKPHMLDKSKAETLIIFIITKRFERLKFRCTRGRGKGRKGNQGKKSTRRKTRRKIKPVITSSFFVGPRDILSKKKEWETIPKIKKKITRKNAYSG